MYSNNTNDGYAKIYSKEKKLFFLCVCIPYLGGIILSLILMCIFNCIFTNQKDYNENKNNNELKIKDSSFKKICGYIIFKQTIEKQKNKDIENSDSKTKCNNYFCKSLYLLIKPIADICAECCNCKCCCNYNELSYDNKEINFCLCYQKKGILKWIFDSTDNANQILILGFAFLNFYCQLFTIGFEAEFNERNKEKNEEQFNIIIPLIIAFASFIGISILISYHGFSTISYIRTEIAQKLTDYFFFEAVCFDFLISIVSLVSTIECWNKSFSSIKNIYKKCLYFLLIVNKFLIFSLSYICSILDNENELISYTSFTSIYLYLFELILYGIKKISSINALLIIQIITSSIFIISFILLMIFSLKDEC